MSDNESVKARGRRAPKRGREAILAKVHKLLSDHRKKI